MGLGVVFSGQGNQSSTMFEKLNQYNPILVSELSDKLGFTLLPDINTPNIFANNFAQPLIAGYQYILWNAIAAKIPTPVAISGYSLGEISAFAVNSGLNLDEALAITKIRARLMSSCGDGGLVAVSGLNKSELLPICDNYNCYIAIINGIQHYVIGGKSSDLATAINAINQLPGMINVTTLNVTIPSHTPLLSAAANKFKQYLEGYTRNSLAIPQIAGISANVYYKADDLVSELAKQIDTTILFNQVVEIMAEMGATLILEIGPGHALTNIIKKYNLPLQVKSVDDFSSIDGLITWIKSKTK